MTQKCAAGERQAGFSLIELMVVLAILLSVSAIVLSLLFQMTMTQGSVANRTEMHSSVRSATEVLQQEISQAGRIAFPDAVLPVTLTAPVTVIGVSSSVTVSPGAGLFNGPSGGPGIILAIDAGPNREVVQVTVAGDTVTGVFNYAHAAGAPVEPIGAFPTGIVATAPGQNACTNGDDDPLGPPNFTDGSTCDTLKMYGDINDDGSMVYVQYECDTASGLFWRSAMPLDTNPADKPNFREILLTDLLPNPDGTPCFTYEEKKVGNNWYVVNVAVTLTVQTQYRDPQTNLFQTETKALLNVSPRNVFEAWQLASGQIGSYLQPMPDSVTNLLP